MTKNAIELAQALIRCPSVTPIEGGALEVLHRRLEMLGFTCHRKVFSEPGTDSVDNLYARFGKTGPNLCFAGHTDVVPVGDESAWDYPPFGAEIHDGVLYGRGAEDMKSAIAAFVAATAEYLGANRRTMKGSISLLITGDEEGVAINGTKKMLQWLKETGEVIDACIVGEPTNPSYIGEMVKIGRRGSVSFTLTVRGHQGHVAYPQLADNPVTKLVEILHRLKSTMLDSGNEFFQPSNLEVTTVDVGNPAVNVIPAVATAKFNIRFNDLHTSAELEKWVRRICSEVTEHYDLQVRVTGEAFLTKSEQLSSILVQAIKEVTGKEPELSTTGGTSDARFIKDYCPVVEFGTTGKTSHMVNECVKVADVELLAKIYGKVIEGFFRGVL